MKKIFIISILLISPFCKVNCQIKLLTVAEKSEFKSTSNYNDVMTFIDQLKKSSKIIRVESIATSVEGRDVPLLIIGNPLPKSPEQLKNDSQDSYLCAGKYSCRRGRRERGCVDVRKGSS